MEWYEAVYGSYLATLRDIFGKCSFVRISLKSRKLSFRKAKVRQA